MNKTTTKTYLMNNKMMNELRYFIKQNYINESHIYNLFTLTLLEYYDLIYSDQLNSNINLIKPNYTILYDLLIEKDNYKSQKIENLRKISKKLLDSNILDTIKIIDLDGVYYSLSNFVSTKSIMVLLSNFIDDVIERKDILSESLDWLNYRNKQSFLDFKNNDVLLILNLKDNIYDSKFILYIKILENHLK